MRCSIVGLLPWPRHDGIEEPEVLRRVDGSSVYTIAGANLNLAADPRRRGAFVTTAGRRGGASVGQVAVDLALLEMAANGTALDSGQASLVRQMCTSGARLLGAIAPPAPGKQRLCAPSLLPGPKTAVRCSAWLRRLLWPRSSASKPVSAPTPWPSSPGHLIMANCRSGRQR